MNNSPPIRIYTNPWPKNQTRPLTELWEVSKGQLRRVWHADRERLLLRTPSPIPFVTYMCSTCWDQSFSRTWNIYRMMHFEHPSVLSRVCIVQNSLNLSLDHNCFMLFSRIWIWTKVFTMIQVCVMTFNKGRLSKVQIIVQISCQG